MSSWQLFTCYVIVKKIMISWYCVLVFNYLSTITLDMVQWLAFATDIWVKHLGTFCIGSKKASAERSVKCKLRLAE